MDVRSLVLIVRVFNTPAKPLTTTTKDENGPEPMCGCQ